MTVRNDPRPWERGCQYPRHADEMNAALDRQRQEITAEIEAAHLEQEMTLAADLDAAKAEIFALKDYRQAVEDRLDNLRKYVNSVVEEYEELVTYLRCAEGQRDSATERNKQLLAELHEMRRRWMNSDQLDRENDHHVFNLEATIRDLTEKVERLEKRKAVICDRCDGHGDDAWSDPAMRSACPDCHGTGAVIVDGDSGREG